MSLLRGPIISVSLFDADRPDLAARSRAAVASAGLAAYVSEADGTDGTVVVVEVAVGDLGLRAVEDTPAWSDLGATLGAIADEVSPAIAVAGDNPVLDLDDPAWRTDRLTFCSGRVDVERLDLERRHAFNELVGHHLVEVRDGAVRWATPPGVPLGVGLVATTPLALAAATYEAWTGEPADLEPVTDPALDAVLPTLWFWSPDGAASLEPAVAAALPAWDAEADDEHGAFGVVVAVARDPLDQDSALAALRTAVPAVGAAWAGLLPRGGFVPPGVDPSLAASGVVDHLWLARDWSGPLVEQVAAALDGVTPDDVGEGVLFVTGPDPRVDRIGPFPWTPLERWARLVTVAGLLGSHVRDAVGEPDFRL